MTWHAQLYNLKEHELDKVVWRYLTFPKFISLVSYGALWFERLCFLPDQLEGTIPCPALAIMKDADQHWKSVITDPVLKAQIDGWHERNVADGKSLTLANCWYIGDHESEEMWETYGKSPESVVVRSTIRRVWSSTLLCSDFSFIGPVEYVDHSTFGMEPYPARQAHHRSFLKDRRQFANEQELRLTTMNFRTPACLDPLGRPLTVEEVSGVGMNNFDSRGLYVTTNIGELIEGVVTHPKASDWFHNLILHMQIGGQFKGSVEKSSL